MALVKKGDSKRPRLKILFFYRAQFVGLQSFIDQNPKAASDF
jgi:hypothetical protein